MGATGKEPHSPRGTKLAIGKQMPTGRGWRLIPPAKTARIKASLISKFTANGERFAVFHIFKS